MRKASETLGVRSLILGGLALLALGFGADLKALTAIGALLLVWAIVLILYATYSPEKSEEPTRTAKGQRRKIYHACGFGTRRGAAINRPPVEFQHQHEP